MAIKIVRTDEHEEEIRALDARCFRPSEAEPVGLDEDRDMWVALDGDQVVGYLVAQAHDENGGTRHYLDRYGVDPAYAGHGIGKRLCRAWLRHASKSPGWAWTYVYTHNAQSINALISMGFRAWQCTSVPESIGDPGGYHPLPRFCMWRRAIG